MICSHRARMDFLRPVGKLVPKELRGRPVCALQSQCSVAFLPLLARQLSAGQSPVFRAREG